MPAKKSSVPFVHFMPNGNKLYVQWRFRTNVKVGGKLLDCYIPAFEIYFNAKTKEEVHKKSISFVRLFFRYYLEGNNKKGLKALVLQLKRLGFKANNDLFAVRELSRNRFIDAKFKSPVFVTPHEFHEEEEIGDQLEVA